MNKNYTFGSLIRKNRKSKNLPIRKLAAALDLDPSTLSKIERGERQANKKLVRELALFFKLEVDELMTVYLSDKVVNELNGIKNKIEVLKVAEEKIEYRTK